VKSAPELRFTLVNRAAERLFGYDRSEMLGKAAVELFPDRGSRITSQDREALEGGKPMVTEDHVVTNTATGDRLISAKKVPIAGLGGAPEHLLSVLEDVTDKRAADDRIRRMALCDPLTQLPNRLAFQEFLARLLKIRHQSSACFAWILTASRT
jgi:PAS domain S-box-containing protein